MTDLRIGQGFDVHRFGPDGPLILCGCEIEGEGGLEGHSDADLALHAVADAILGAAALGDLGEHFPETGEQWQNVASSIILGRCLELAKSAGLVPVNCDLTLIGERPRIAPHRRKMRRALAGLLAIDERAVSVKATTTDGLGCTGRGEGLAAVAIILMRGVPNGG
jgi:2-C-methyl-D-erythritol 4-phosphate cytidylyltransferase/2-C-methyl-D-erythritol 2,4-cyclodiphosphate synthase